MLNLGEELAMPMDTHVGGVQITDNDNNPTIVLDGNQQEIRLGSATGAPVRFTLVDGVAAEVRLSQTGAEAGITLTILRESPECRTEIGPGSLILRGPGSQRQVQLSGDGLELWDSDGRKRASASRTGHVLLSDTAENSRVDLRGANGTITLFDTSGVRRVSASSSGRIRLYDAEGNETVSINATNGDIKLQDDTGQTTVRLLARDAAIRAGGGGKDGRMLVRNASGAVAIDLAGSSGDIRLAGADCAENFRTTGPMELEPGTVVVSEGGEQVGACTAAYDRRAVGIIAGAGGYRPAIRLAAAESEAGQVPVALMGRVYCKVDAEYAPVEIGDLLTTSPTPGHAMRASDPSLAFGAVLGKALGRLESGRGLLPILVTLQ
jgi:hypothetical protein